jgi:hypothetical protein
MLLGFPRSGGFEEGAEMTPSDPTAEIDADLRNLVERAFDETTVDVADAGDAPAYRSDDAERAWSRMHEAAEGRETAVLLEMLDGTWLGGEARWKAVTFLGFGLRTAASGPERDAILAAIAIEAAVKNRGSVAGDLLRVQRAALEAIAGSTLDADAKWQCMLDALPASRSHFREVLDALSLFRPSSQAALVAAQPILLDALVRSDSTEDLDRIAELVRELDVRSAMPDLRRLLLAASSNLSARVAPILADWGDVEAAFEIRRVINQYSNASDPNVDALVDSLYRISGPACTDFLADAFRQAPPALQEHLLEHSLRSIPSAAITKSVREVAESTKDVDLRKAAQEYLASVPAPAVAEDAASPAAEQPATTEASGWQPVYEGASTKPAAAAAPPAQTAAVSASTPAPSTPATPDAAAGSWQPTTESPGAGGDEVRSRRLGVEAEALALIRQEAEAARLAAEQQQAEEDTGPNALEFLVKLPQILFALALVGALLYLVLGSGGAE